ncbi:MAG: ribonuclease III [Nitrospinae bacterium]|nr:ribonuclease III [Nitrospinota bacterium]
MIEPKRLVELKELSRQFGYTFKNLEYLNKSLTHKSYANENQSYPVKDNERFEFLGDSVIDLVVSRYLLFQNRQMSEGELSKIRAQIVNEQSLADLARAIRLGHYLLLGKGEEQSGGREKNSILANTFEAVFAALFLDSSYAEVYEIFLRLFKNHVDTIVAQKRVTDYKGLLQKYCQAHILSNPQYKLVKESGPDHEKVFVIQAYILGEPFGMGIGRTKKEAEQAAARHSYESLTERHKHVV